VTLRAAVRRARRRRRTVLAAVLAAAVVIPAAAYAVARQLAPGDPAPPEVKQALTAFANWAELIPTPGPNDPVVDKVRVAAVLDASRGRVDLFVGPTVGHQLCGWVWIEGRYGYQHRPNMSGVCGFPKTTLMSLVPETMRSPTPALAVGRVGDDVDRAMLRLSDGRRVDLGLYDRWFMVEVRESGSVKLLAFDRHGRPVDDGVALTPDRRRPPVRPRLHLPTKPRELMSLRTEDGERIVLSVGATRVAGLCSIIRSDRRLPAYGCGIDPPGRRELGVGPMQFGGAPGGVQLLTGRVGADIARLEVRYQDGRVRDALLKDGWALYAVARRDYAAGRRPAEIVGLDAAGKQVATVRLPWAGG
jgi:hypothetical protein